MRGGVSLQAVRARVDRLAADCPDADAVTVLSWQNPACVSCGLDLLAHARAEAVNRARATGARLVWADTLIHVCPGCGIPNPAAAAERSGAVDAC